jgi:hypothetical protein
MRPWLGWVAAALLIALAFAGGPDALDTSPPASHTQVAAKELGEKRDPQVRDEAPESPDQIVDRGTPGHPRLAALPPSPQTAAPIPVRGAPQGAPQAAPAGVSDVSERPHLGACTPEALQIFRC